MWNWLWAHLVNRPYDGAELTVPGGVAVPPGFRPGPVAGPAAAARAAVFGADPDRPMLAYRARQLVRLVHAGPLADLAVAADPRVAYDPADAAWADPAATAPRVDPPTARVAGDPAPPDATGRMAHRYRVTASDDAGAEAVPLLGPPAADPGSVAEAEWDGGDGLWDGAAGVWAAVGGRAVPLPGSGLALVVPGPGAWAVDLLLRPARGPAEVVAAVGRLPAAADLFAGAAGPYPRLRAAWHSDVGPDRAAALALALAYRAAEARRAG